MTLADLAMEIKAIDTHGHLEGYARDVTHDSRQCSPGSVFVAIRGQNFDGHRFIPQALERGAVAIVSEQDFENFAVGTGAAWIQVVDARAALAWAGAGVHGHPSRRMKLVGITGTNGKTTTAHLIDSIIRAAENTSSMFGTINYRIGDQCSTAHRTTPEASDIQRMLAQSILAGCRSAVMEVSSHAIELHRADALHLAVAVFTNLTRDHLDYHQTMDAYFEAKEKMFTGILGSKPGASVLNIDDEYGRRLLKTTRGRPVITYGLDPSADVRTNDFKQGETGLEFRATTPKGEVKVTSQLIGRPHVYNILAAISAGLCLEFNLDDIKRGIAACTTVAGRFERVSVTSAADLGFTVIVDYAHTDDALKNVLQTARELAGKRGRVITVFGCGGDRDRTKRAPMGEIAASMSDVAIVTSDNPRSEDPDAIISDIEIGLRRSGKPYLKQTDRRTAIRKAVNQAREGDVVLIAGKGHETYQIVGDQTIHFDDREEAREAMKKREGS